MSRFYVIWDTERGAGHKHHSGPFATRREAEHAAVGLVVDRAAGRRVLAIAIAITDDDES